jgi:hypothetical protein
MKKSTIKALGKGLQQEFKPPEDLPFPLQKALKALAELPAEAAEECPAEKPRQSSNGQ